MSFSPAYCRSITTEQVASLRDKTKANSIYFFRRFVNTNNNNATKLIYCGWAVRYRKCLINIFNKVRFQDPQHYLLIYLKNKMGYQVYMVGKRWGGYGVPAICEQPECNKKIDRGMSYACGGEPFSEVGCDRYFCSKHLHFTGFKRDGSDERCDCEENCKCEVKEVCERCRDGKRSFNYKPEHPTWMKHLIKHESWEEWRKENPETVEEFKKALLKIKKK